MDLFTLDVHPWALFWIGFFTVFTYLNAGWLRHQVCLHMCPYARFQSAMFDANTLIVSYDAARGEPRRNHPRKGVEASRIGDCIDCELCVQVCPTGIDIRDGNALAARLRLRGMDTIEVAAFETRHLRVSLTADGEALTQPSHPVELRFVALEDPSITNASETRFLGPSNSE